MIDPRIRKLNGDWCVVVGEDEVVDRCRQKGTAMRSLRIACAGYVHGRMDAGDIAESHGYSKDFADLLRYAFEYGRPK